MRMDASCSKSDCGMPSLGLSIDLSISVNQSQQHQQQQQQAQAPHPRMDSEERITPLQLDLLPRPVAQKKNGGLLWESLFSNSRAETSDSTAAQAPNSSLSKGLDMNQIPCLAESEEVGVGVSAATSFQLMELPNSRRLDAKREREVEEPEQMALPRAASDEEEGGTRKKLRLSKEQSALLEESFREHSTLNPKQKNALAKQLNLRPRQVEVWFQNRRARTKLKQTEVDCELLKKYCEGLSEENRRLQKELQELRALKISPPCVITHDFYMPLPATTLTMCPSCERLAAVDNSSNNNNTNMRSHHHHGGAAHNSITTSKQPTPSFHTNTSGSATVVTQPPPPATPLPHRFPGQPSLLQPV